jgi:cytochrome c oxidase subunit 4
MSTETTSHSDVTVHEGEHDEHHPSDGKYIQIALILGVITAAEVAVSYIDIGPLFVPSLIVMMVAKFGIVAAFFMHLKFDNSLLTRVFVAGILLAIGVYIAAMGSMHIFDS